MLNLRHLLLLYCQSWYSNLRFNTIHWVKMFYLHLSFQSHQFAPVRAHPQHNICTVLWRVHRLSHANGSDRPRATKLFCRHGAGEFLVVHSVLPLRNSVEVGGRKGGRAGECCDGVGENGTDWRHVLLAEARRRHAGTPPSPIRR